MTFEERTDRLSERHEAWAQSQAAMMDAIARLAHIADIQDHRITRFEEGKQ
jgi:hypothetical protein